MTTMPFIFDDGGRKAAGYKGFAGDCVARSIAIASGLPYAKVYADLAKIEGSRRGNTKGESARNGIHTNRKAFKDYMVSLGFVWTATMGIGTGCRVHLDAQELPKGRLVVAVSKHYTSVIDGVIHDTHNPSDRPTTVYPATCPLKLVPKWAKPMPGGGWSYAPQRCVYGYWTFIGNKA